jgi:hypothetical protein
MRRYERDMMPDPDRPPWYAGLTRPFTRGVRTPLTTNQHILFLLATVFTGGLFLPFWIILTILGNRTETGQPNVK